MTQKRYWNDEEDKNLVYLRENCEVIKWSQIARKMNKKFGLNSRNGKQCRERYIIHLQSQKSSFKWGMEEREKLIELHRIKGNKWAEISKHFQGTTENFIKNQFYSRMRKSIRRINRAISQHFEKDYKQLKLNIVFKLSRIFDHSNNGNDRLPPELRSKFAEMLYVFIDLTSEKYFCAALKKQIERELCLVLVKSLHSLQDIFNFERKISSQSIEASKTFSFQNQKESFSKQRNNENSEKQNSAKMKIMHDKAEAELIELLNLRDRLAFKAPTQIEKNEGNTTLKGTDQSVQHRQNSASLSLVQEEESVEFFLYENTPKSNQIQLQRQWSKNFELSQIYAHWEKEGKSSMG